MSIRTRKNKQLSKRAAAAHKPSNRFGVWRSRNNKASTTHLLELLCNILGAGIDVVVGTKLGGEILLIRRRRDGHSLVSHLSAVLYSEMTCIYSISRIDLENPVTYRDHRDLEQPQRCRASLASGECR